MTIVGIPKSGVVQLVGGKFMNDINKTIKHFESLQKRYTTQHNGKMCDRVSDALEALYRFKNQEEYFKTMFGSKKV